MQTPGSRFCRRQWFERWGRRESGAQSATWDAATKLSMENFDVILRVGGRSHSTKQQTRTELVRRGGRQGNSFVVQLFQPWWISVMQKSNGLIIRRACSEFAFSKPLLAHTCQSGTTRGPHNDVTARIVLASLKPKRRWKRQLI